MPRRKTIPMNRPFLTRFARGAPQKVVWSLERDRELAHADSPYMFCPHQLWRPRPNARLPWTASERFNAEGYRGPMLSVERPAKTLRIAALGGAATLGVGVANEDTFVSVAARLLTSRTMRSEAMNLGVENYSLRQSLERYREVARPYRPHVVLVTVSTRASYSPAAGGMTDDELIERYRPLDVRLELDPPSVEDGLRV